MSKVLPSKSRIISTMLALLFTANAVAGDVAESHRAVSKELIRLADAIDGIFGAPRATDQTNRTSLRLSESFDWTGRGKDVFGTEVRLNLRLPILERQGKAVTEPFRFDSKKVTEQDVAERAEQKNRWHLRAEPGIRIANYVSVFEKARATKSFLTSNFVHNFSQEVTWDSATLWEESTLIESDFALTDRVLLRVRNQGDWAISDSRFFSYHGPSLIQRLSALSALSYNALLTSQVRTGRWVADTYTLSVNYRQAIYENWAFAELTPALLFQKEQRFKGMTNLTARLEFLFGAI